MSLDVFAIFYVSQLSIMDRVKRVRIRSYSGPYFSRIFLHSDIPHRENAGKMGTRITTNTDSFNAVMEGSITNPTNQMVREIRRD